MVVTPPEQATYPKEGENLKLETDVAVAEPADGQILVKVLNLSVDPYHRFMMTANTPYGTTNTFPMVMHGESVAKVIASKSDDFKEGSLVCGFFGWQEYATVDPKVPQLAVRPAIADVPTEYNLGILGMPGATAYFGLLRLCTPKEGETVLVSGAAGAVGSYVGQIAKVKGCRAVGLAGGPEKCKHVVENLGFDACIDYKGKDAKALIAEFNKEAPKGVDCYFDNTGGVISYAAFQVMNLFGRVAICGQISQYCEEAEKYGSFLTYVLRKQLKVEGFIVSRWNKERPEAMKEIAGWIKEGKIKPEFDFTDGIENTLDGFLDLFGKGKRGTSNRGKKVIRIAAE
eukprot:TRINITY_DN67480_c7_g1_i1.p2 TRINITY_DN67480_c7_g1~~TRINITY_DN67480_c7_g1_i1.p2  ORF type:complete len:362 (-),score=60.82 TRINITY_DN67480_c7_g1_i1:137-1165(-)